MFGLPATATRVGKKSRPEKMPFSTFPAGDVAGPAGDHRHAHAAFHDRPLAGGEGRVAAIGPGEVLGAVVGREHDDRVVVETVGLQLVHHAADDVVELRHHAFFQIPLVLRRQLRGDISATDAR